MTAGYDLHPSRVTAIRTSCAVPSLSVELLSFACPRCRASVNERLYGPCASCRDQLRAKYVIEGRVIELADYEPKMNVTPNAVAVKDD